MCYSCVSWNCSTCKVTAYGCKSGNSCIENVCYDCYFVHFTKFSVFQLFNKCAIIQLMNVIFLIKAKQETRTRL